MVALGRKNYLFCGSDAGGERAAAIYSLNHPINRIDELLPWNVAAALRGEDQPLELAA